MSAEVEVAALGAAAGVLLAAAGWIIMSTRVTPEARERQRRFMLSQHGRLAHGVLTGSEQNTLHYRYEISGVAYSTTQDISGLRELLPTDPQRLIGPVTS